MAVMKAPANSKVFMYVWLMKLPSNYTVQIVKTYRCFIRNEFGECIIAIEIFQCLCRFRRFFPLGRGKCAT